MRFRLLPTLLILFYCCSAASYAAAPDDIVNNQRAWFDAVDLNANGDYTDNPANNSAIAQWRDKSGVGHDISASGTAQPFYRHDSLLTDRHGVDFDGINNSLTMNNDVWSGSVDTTESFIVATTDRVKNSFLFASSGLGNRNRLSAHTPWGNGLTYFDQGLCCGAPTRIIRNIPITLSTGYLWHFIGTPTLQAIVRDGATQISDPGAGVYNAGPDTVFTMAGWRNNRLQHDGRIFEAVFYQAALNNAQRNIITSYLSAKWNRPHAAGADYTDVYQGDDSSNGDYDYFVGGIGQSGGQQSVGTSQGLTINDDTFLTADGKYVTAGVDYLLTNPKTGVLGTELPATYIERSNRSWFIDTTGSGGVVTLTFDASKIGIPIANGAEYGLLYRSGTSGTFSEVATSTMTSGMISFSHLPADGVYTVGRSKNKVDLDVKKIVSNAAPNIGDTITFTLTINNNGPTDAYDAQVEDIVPAGFANLAPVSSPPGSVFSITGNTVTWTGLSIPVGGSVSAVFSAVVLP